MTPNEGKIRLSALAGCSGCAAKFSAQSLAQLLRPVKDIFQIEQYPLLLAGLDQPDDAAVWKIDENKSLVVTTDFFTPIVDDPYDFGAIAATNSISDIYAMGGEPFLALNILTFPPQLPHNIATEILRGGAEKAKEAGVVIAGGHTIQDKEPKYGLVVIGFVETGKILTKGGLRPGDVIFLSKPVGSGIITAALKIDQIISEDAAETIGFLKRLNRDASVLARKFHATAATDITGFSLLGHAWEMVSSSQAGVRFFYKDIPLYPHVEELSRLWCFPGAGFDNADYFGSHVHFAPEIEQERQLILFDPQTSGGLLFAVPQGEAEECKKEAEKLDIPLWKVGEATDSGIIEVV